MASRVRLFLDHPLGEGQTLPLEKAQAHYLFVVMRLGAGAGVAVFNGRDGEWLAEIAEAGKKGGTLRAVERLRPQAPAADLWLLFAPVKKARTDFIVEKATEMGATRLLPVQTDFTNSERVRVDRLQALAVEAAEQSERLDIPGVADLARLGDVLAAWPGGRDLWLCDEGLRGDGAGAAGSGPGAVLIGPEGGFSDAERTRLAALPFVQRVALGPRVLRADTAAVAALTLWQAARGDWR